MSYESTADYHNFYTIKDFYEFIRRPDNLPTTHRHFQVYFYPQYNIYKNFQTYQSNNQYSFIERVYNNMNELFTVSNFERIALSIQSITLPVTYNFDANKSIKTPMGIHNTHENNVFANGTGQELTFKIIDQIIPQFETFFNKWMYICSLGQTQTEYSYGYPFPKVNIAIKYFKENDPNLANPYVENLKPNFIYYFTDVFPFKFETCKINHSPTGDEEITRTVSFKYNMCYVLPSASYARRYKLEYLFNTVLELQRLKENEEAIAKAEAEKKAALQKQYMASLEALGAETQLRDAEAVAAKTKAEIEKERQTYMAARAVEQQERTKVYNDRKQTLDSIKTKVNEQTARQQELERAVAAKQDIVHFQNAKQVYAIYLKEGKENTEKGKAVKARMLELANKVRGQVGTQIYGEIVRTNNSTEINKKLEQRLQQSKQNLQTLQRQEKDAQDKVNSHQQGLQKHKQETAAAEQVFKQRLQKQQKQSATLIAKKREQSDIIHNELPEKQEQINNQIKAAEAKLQQAKINQQNYKQFIDTSKTDFDGVKPKKVTSEQQIKQQQKKSNQQIAAAQMADKLIGRSTPTQTKAKPAAQTSSTPTQTLSALNKKQDNEEYIDDFYEPNDGLRHRLDSEEPEEEGSNY